MMRQTRGRPRIDSRSRLVAAAALEFAERGYEGAGVDRIARRAGVNKAMIYYHFASKAGLYREILQELFRIVVAGVTAIAGTADSPETKIRAFVALLAREVSQRPHFAPMMLRELADQGRHLDATTLRLLTAVPRTFDAILREGRTKGCFASAALLPTYATIVGPLLFYFASAPVRAEISRLHLADLDHPELSAFVSHVQAVTLGTLRSGADSSRRSHASNRA